MYYVTVINLANYLFIVSPSLVDTNLRINNIFLLIGVWSGKCVLYPYNKNNLELRTHAEFIKTGKSAEEKSTEKRVANVEGVKGLSCLLKVISYPQQVVLDYMHLVCIGHVPTLIKRWCQLITKDDIIKMDNMLSMTRVPHNIHVMYNESIADVDLWKAKHGRLLVLNLGVPIGSFRVSIFLFGL